MSLEDIYFNIFKIELLVPLPLQAHCVDQMDKGAV